MDIRGTLKKPCAFAADRRGLAAIDFALISMMLALGMINAVDVGFFMYQRMEVEYAAETGAQAAYNNCAPPCTPQSCPPRLLPATQNAQDYYCTATSTATGTGAIAAITRAIQSTALGRNVTLASGYPTEAYYCTNASNALQNVGSVSNPAPSDCSAAGNASASPGDYIQVQVTYPYTPLFSGLSVMGAVGITSITKTSWMRLG